MTKARRFQAQADRNRAQTWKVIDTETGKVIAAGYPAFYAKDIARDCNADSNSIWLRA